MYLTANFELPKRVSRASSEIRSTWLAGRDEKAENVGSFSHNFPRPLAGARARLPAGSAFASECVIQLYLTLVKGGSGRSVGRSVGGWAAMGRLREYEGRGGQALGGGGSAGWSTGWSVASCGGGRVGG